MAAIIKEMVEAGHPDDAARTCSFLLENFDPYDLSPELVEEVLAFDDSEFPTPEGTNGNSN